MQCSAVQCSAVQPGRFRSAETAGDDALGFIAAKDSVLNDRRIVVDIQSTCAASDARQGPTRAMRRAVD